jgi:hypothetical protein
MKKNRTKKEQLKRLKRSMKKFGDHNGTKKKSIAALSE